MPKKRIAELIRWERIKMDKINWNVRFKHKPFLVALFSALLMLITQISQILGVDTTVISEQVTPVFNTILGILILLGVVIDPTTESISDSKQALSYEEPKKD